MNINRHNYESYFILYMDNELGPEERLQLEAFVLNHPDLKEELDTLLHYKLTPDTSIVFPGKEELLKGEGLSQITHSNEEEWLILYADNELTPGQKKTVEEYVSTRPAVKAELELLQKARLEPELLVFAAKNSLYRREEVARRISPLWRRAAAAILILAIGTASYFIFNNRSSQLKDKVAKTGPAHQPEFLVKPKSVTPETTDKVVPSPREDKPVLNIAETKKNRVQPIPAPQQQENNVAVNKSPVPDNKLQNANPVPIKKEEPVVADNNTKISNNLPQPVNNPNLQADKTITTADKALAKNDLPEETRKMQSSTDKPAVTNPAIQPSDIVNASYQTTDADFSQGGKKNKLRGLFRKITRTFEKRTNINTTTDDNKLLVGGLAIRLK